MRQNAGTLNRTWLAILSILTLAAGTALLLQAGGQLRVLINAATPPPGTPVVSGDLHAMFAPPWVAGTVLAAGVLLGLLGLLWIIAQIPRKNPAPSYRLHHDGGQGFTFCDPAVLATAVENQVATLPGVIASTALLRGTATAPDLTVKMTVNDRADIQDIIHQIHTSTLPELAAALETPLARNRLQIEVSPRTQSSGIVVPSTGTVVL